MHELSQGVPGSAFGNIRWDGNGGFLYLYRECNVSSFGNSACYGKRSRQVPWLLPCCQIARGVMERPWTHNASARRGVQLVTRHLSLVTRHSHSALSTRRTHAPPCHALLISLSIPLSRRLSSRPIRLIAVAREVAPTSAPLLAEGLTRPTPRQCGGQPAGAGSVVGTEISQGRARRLSRCSATLACVQRCHLQKAAVRHIRDSCSLV